MIAQLMRSICKQCEKRAIEQSINVEPTHITGDGAVNVDDLLPVVCAN